MPVRFLSAIVGAALLTLVAATPAAAASPTRPFGSLIEAESFDATLGVRVLADANASGGHAIAFSAGDWLRFDSVDFGAPGQTSGFATWRSCATGAGTIELRLDSPTATPFLTLNPAGGGCAQWYQSSLRLGLATTPTGVHSFYMHARAEGGCEFYRFDSLQLIKQTGPPIP
ncbi:carbohydrate-binding protein [Actinoplanes sp. NPDC051513]|uniref:carbohydrate-binding protein n=1 Tax=Actinoplanes sp. NPDC051513 TaxID=3363908 RepID=UPI0037ACECEE